MNIGDIVVVIGTESVPESFLGRYGRVEDVNDYKVSVEFNQRVGSMGSLIHTVYPSELIKVGESNY
jgi:hypothetical protein